VNKAAEAFRTISEVADELAVAKHVLRFWEQKFPQVRPMKRGGGRRYYRPEDIDLLRGIHHLLHNEGYTIRGVQKILRNHGLEQVKTCWQKNAARPVVPLDTLTQKEAGKRKSAAPKPKGRPQLVSAPLPAEVRSTIEAALSELNACRKLLAAPPGLLGQQAIASRRSGR
jgi:DNA-binding transcriptional MerR regulator